MRTVNTGESMSSAEVPKVAEERIEAELKRSPARIYGIAFPREAAKGRNSVREEFRSAPWSNLDLDTLDIELASDPGHTNISPDRSSQLQYCREMIEEFGMGCTPEEFLDSRIKYLERLQEADDKIERRAAEVSVEDYYFRICEHVEAASEEEGINAAHHRGWAYDIARDYLDDDAVVKAEKAYFEIYVRGLESEDLKVRSRVAKDILDIGKFPDMIEERSKDLVGESLEAFFSDAVHKSLMPGNNHSLSKALDFAILWTDLFGEGEFEGRNLFSGCSEQEVSEARKLVTELLDKREKKLGLDLETRLKGRPEDVHEKERVKLQAKNENVRSLLRELSLI